MSWLTCWPMSRREAGTADGRGALDASCPAPGPCWGRRSSPWPSQDHRERHHPAHQQGSRRGGGPGAGPGRADHPRLPAGSDHQGRHGHRAQEGEEAAGARGEAGPGGTVGRGLRQRRPRRPGTPPGRGARRRPADHLVGPPAQERPGWTGTWTSSAPAPSWTCSPAPTPAPPPRPDTRPVPGGFATNVNLTVPLATTLGLADRPGDLAGFGPVDPWLARDLANAAAANPATTWCVTLTDQQGHAIAHGCARPQPSNHSKRETGQPRPAGSTRTTTKTVRLRVHPHQPRRATRRPRHLDPHHPRQRTRPHLLPAPLTTENCDHRFQTQGHDPGVKLRHLAQIRHATCTSPICRRPAATCDYEHNIPFEAGGRTCLCNGGPKCRHDHRLKQHPKWKVEQRPDGTFRWTTPSGRTYTTEPTRYPI